jgi:hypothetical protein
VRADASTSARAGIGWGLVTAGGLIVAIVAVMALSVSRSPAAAGARLVPHLPDAVALAVTALFALAALLILGLLWPQELRRRRRKGDEEFELSYEPPKVSPWVSLVLVLLVVLLLVAVGAAFWVGWPPEHGTQAPLPATAPASGEGPLQGGIDRPSRSMPAFDIAVAVFGVVAGTALLGVMVWLYFGDRLARWWVGRVFDDATRPWRDAAVEGLEDLRREPDARRAIVKCYRRFEQVLATARTPRAPWQTPTEFMRAVLGRLALPHEAVRMLTGLFELSRFSDRHLGTTERDIACDCLEEIKTVLERREPDATRA